MRRDAGICLILALVTLAAYWPVSGHDFINYDDPGYVSQNPLVEQGLTWDGITWAMTTTRESNWHPLTWLSHMLDFQVFGPRPGWHHLMSVFLHIANSVLLYLVLARMTAAPWRSAAVAALFALHPLHVESVAWASERKDVLSTLFWMLTMAAYVYYVRRPSVWRYVPVFVLLGLGLAAKPMLVTLPLVFLLLDYWPLGRFSAAEGARPLWRTAARRVLEKAPLLALAAASSVLTYLVQERGGSVVSKDYLPVALRLENALTAYVGYLGKAFWPIHLAVFYPLEQDIPLWHLVAAGALVLGVSAAAVVAARRRPYLAVGWFWYAGTLVPVIGLVQVGGQSMADRYLYVPLTGLAIAAVWGITDLLVRRRYGRPVLAVAAVAVIAACTALTAVQVGYWKDSKTLFEHSLAAIGDNAVAHNNLGMLLADEGKTAEAIQHYRAALALRPLHVDAHNNLGNALHRLGQNDAAEAHYREAIRLNPVHPMAHYNYGNLLTEEGRFDQAIAEYHEALRIHPDDPQVYNNLGNALVQRGRLDEAAACYRAAIRLAPTHARPYYNLGKVLRLQGRPAEAAASLTEAIRFQPTYAKALNELAWLRATDLQPAVRGGPEAVRLAEQACQLTARQDPLYLDTLAAAYAEAGRFPEAVAAAQQAAAVATARGQKELAAQIQTRLELYRAGKPYREPAPAGAIHP